MKKPARMFNGILVREARAAIHVQPNKEDIRGATREDPENCAYARCIRRTMEAKSVFVFSTIAYVETLDHLGQPVMERYHVRHHARNYLLRFDGGEKVEPGGFVFHPPAKCKTLDYKILVYHKRKREGKSTTGPKNTGATRSKPQAYTMRNGKGAVHFITAQQILVNRK
jgi:hypothetical protein